jgi:TonB family protein
MTEPRSVLNAALLLAAVLASAAARAQPAPQSSAAASAAERAQKETDRTMYWIRVLATTPAPVKAAPAPATRPAAAVAAAAAPAVKPAAEARDKAKAVAAATPAATSVVAKATTNAPAPATVAMVPQPAPVPLGGAAPGRDHASGVATAVADPATGPAPEVASGPAAEPDPGLIQVRSVRPDFPFDFMHRVHKGNVEVRFEVEPGGTVADAVVVASSHVRLNGPALAAVRQWLFKPTVAAHTALVNLVFDVDHES